MSKYISATSIQVLYGSNCTLLRRTGKRHSSGRCIEQVRLVPTLAHTCLLGEYLRLTPQGTLHRVFFRITCLCCRTEIDR